jgi:ABC-type phosphate/phosphonate transport system substrate-binding protein
MGAVAYDPKVVTIWNGFRDYFRENDLDFDYVLFSNYERQVEAHLSGHVHVAWNSPLAWLETEAVSARLGRKAEAVCMRDTDRDLTSVVVVLPASGLEEVGDLRGRRVGVGAADSPQATLIPLDHLARAGLAPGEYETVRFDVGLGLHGDHIGGERQAAEALRDGRVEAACMIDSNFLAFVREGVLTSGARVLARTHTYDHCNFTVLDGAPSFAMSRFLALLAGMSYGNRRLRPLLDLEGLKHWLPGRTEGYRPLSEAIARFGTVENFVNRLAAS